MVTARKVILIFGAAACALLATAVAADIYRWTDDEGNVVFSDSPRDGAERVDIGETTVVPAFRAEPSAPETPAADAGQAGYERIAIARPAHEETLRNVREITVEVSLSPPLLADRGHRVQLYFDGAAHGEPAAATSFVVPVLDRGAHNLQAAVVDAEDHEIGRSAVSTFFLHLTSVQQRGGGGGKP